MSDYQYMATLTPEALRDIARNESASRPNRKAAIKFLVDRNHRYARHWDFRELREEVDTTEIIEEKSVFHLSLAETPSPESELNDDGA